MGELALANPKLRDIPFEVRLRPRRNLIIGTLLVCATVLVAALGFAIMLLLTAEKIGCLIMLVLVATIAAVLRVARLARRHFIDPQRTLLKDPRDPVLYLRSFYDDYEETSSHLNKKTPEENLALVLRAVGPVIAVGKPEDTGLPLLGATRVYLKGTDWQRHVEKLIEASRLIVIHPDISLGVLWELEAVKRLVGPERILISFLHWQSFGLNESSYKRFANTFQEIFGHELPPGNYYTTFVYFDPDWTPHSIEIMPKPPVFNPWLLNYSPYVRIDDIKERLMPVLSKRGMAES